MWDRDDATPARIDGVCAANMASAASPAALNRFGIIPSSKVASEIGHFRPSDLQFT
jgi:hypothetical protein